MSHVSKYKHKVKNLSALKSVLEREGIPYKENCTVNLYGSNRVKADLAFKLPGWRYEVAVTKEGELMYDHYGSQSNTLQKLGETVQAYNKEVIMARVYGLMAEGVSTNWWEEVTKEGTKLILEY